jgi:hypothetical protein
MTVRDICGNADLFRRAYPNWPHAEPEPGRRTAPGLTEITIGWGEDTFCGECLCPLPAGAPAWAAGDGQPVCCDCA